MAIVTIDPAKVKPPKVPTEGSLGGILRALIAGHPDEAEFIAIIVALKLDKQV